MSDNITKVFGKAGTQKVSGEEGGGITRSLVKCRSMRPVKGDGGGNMGALGIRGDYVGNYRRGRSSIKSSLRGAT